MAEVAASPCVAFLRHLLHNDDGCSVFYGSTGAGQTGLTKADDHHVSRFGAGDIAFRNSFRGGAPADLLSLHIHGIRVHALGLRNALGGSFLDGVGSNGGTGYCIHLAALGIQNALGQSFGSRTADRLGSRRRHR